MRRLLLLGSVTYLLLLLGLAARSRGILVLALPFIVYLAASLWYGPTTLRLKLARAINPDRLTEGDLATVRLTITNEGGALGRLVVEDVVPGRLEVVAGTPRAAASLARGGRLELEYQVRARRGVAVFHDVHAYATDPLGLSLAQAVLAAPTQLTVRPRAVRLRRLAIRTLRTRGHAGPVPARLGGPGTDFFGVREYRAGDPWRWINWRVSARHPAGLFTNEFEQERIADVGLVLDARFRSDLHAHGESLLEHSIRAVAALAQAFLVDGNRVGLLVFGRFLYRIFPGYGKQQRERILQALARAEAGDSQVVDSFEYLPTRFFPAQSQIVLVSPVWRDDVEVLLRLRARGYQLLVIRPDAVAFELEGQEVDKDTELAARIVRAERLIVRKRLMEAGVHVVDWDVSRPLAPVVHASLGSRRLWFRRVPAAQ